MEHDIKKENNHSVYNSFILRNKFVGRTEITNQLGESEFLFSTIKFTRLFQAVYADADIYLLDDPLASVDAHVGRSIFENVIKGILSEKTRLLVTHSLIYLKHCNQIIVMKDGKISESGGYEKLMKRSSEFAEIIEEFLMEEAKNKGRSISFGEDGKF